MKSSERNSLPDNKPTVRTGIIRPHARTLELPLLVRSGSFFFLFCLRLGLRGSVFAVRSPPYPREGVSDVLVSGPIIPVLMVITLTGRALEAEEADLQ